jgi:hypothetical protein
MIKKLRSAWKLDEHAVALERLRASAAQLDRSHPAAASLREGLEETLTLQRLEIAAPSKRRSPRPTDASRWCATRCHAKGEEGCGRLSSVPAVMAAPG